MYRRPGPRDTPLGLGLNEGLGRNVLREWAVAFLHGVFAAAVKTRKHTDKDV